MPVICSAIKKLPFWIIFSLILLILTTPALSWEMGLDFTKENLSTGQTNALTGLYLKNKLGQTTIIGNFEVSDRSNARDIIGSLGAYHNLTDTLYAYLNVSLSPTQLIAPSTALETELAWGLLSPFVFVANYRLRHYPNSPNINIYSPGIDWYLPFSTWLAARYYAAYTAEGVSASSWVLKLFYEPVPEFRGYVGYASGSEAYRDIPTPNIISFFANTPLLGFKYKINDRFGIKVDLAWENRDNGTSVLIGHLGTFAEW